MIERPNAIHPLVQAVIPTVIESGPRSERAFDIFSLLLKERIVFLGTPIDDQIANLIVAQLLFLQREDPERDISMYIHSPGGVITAGLAIYDTMQLIEPAVSTIAVGQTASMATVTRNRTTSSRNGRAYPSTRRTMPCWSSSSRTARSRENDR